MTDSDIQAYALEHGLIILSAKRYEELLDAERKVNKLKEMTAKYEVKK